MLFGGKAWMIGGRTGRYGAMPIRFIRALRERSLLPYLFRGKRPEVVHLGASDFTFLGNFYFGNSRRMKGENALHSHAVRYFSHGERRSEPGAAPSDHDSLKLLDAFLVPFDDANMDVHGVARMKTREVRLHLRSFNELQFFHDSLSFGFSQ